MASFLLAKKLPFLWPDYLKFQMDDRCFPSLILVLVPVFYQLRYWSTCKFSQK